jgi:hypothetical protein
VIRLEIGDVPSRGVLAAMRSDIDAALRTLDQADALLAEHDAAGGNVDHRNEALDSMSEAQRHTWMLVDGIANAASEQTVRWAHNRDVDVGLATFWNEEITFEATAAQEQREERQRARCVDFWGMG